MTTQRRTAPRWALAAALLCCASAAHASRATRRTPVVVAVEKAAPAVANISTEEIVIQRYRDPFWGSRDRFFNDMFDDFFGRYYYRRAKIATPLGSGVVIDQDGYIVTNEHVISRASNIKVHLMGRDRIYDATLISADAEQDLAVIKISDKKPFPYIRMGTSSDLMPGETVIAIGNPFGYESSVTTGVLSATGRNLRVPTSDGVIVYKGLLQTTALINPGNSGGPLINLDGELIGINAAIRADAQGIGFAIPVDKVRRVVARLFNFQTKKKFWFGAAVDTAPGGKAGVVVQSVQKDSPAQKAGLRKGDVIRRSDGAAVADLFAFAKSFFKHDVGDRVPLVVERGGKSRKLTVTLRPVPKPSGRQLAREKLGLDVQSLTPALARRLGMRLGEGVLVLEVEPRGPAADAGLQAGDVIIQMGRYLIRNVNELGLFLEPLPKNAVIPVIVVRGGDLGRTRIRVR